MSRTLQFNLVVLSQFKKAGFDKASVAFGVPVNAAFGRILSHDHGYRFLFSLTGSGKPTFRSWL